MSYSIFGTTPTSNLMSVAEAASKVMGLEEAVDLKKLKKEYDKNEDKNYHSENYLLLAKAFGTPAEVKKVEEILKRNKAQGSTSKADNDWMYKNINKYYDKIRTEEVEVAEAVLADRDYEYDGKVIKISKKNFSKVPNDYKNSTKGKERMITYDDKAGTVSVPVQFTEEVQMDEGPMKRQLQIKKDIEHLRALNSKKITSLSKSEYKQKKQYEKDYGNDPMDWEAFIAPLKFKKEEVAEAKGTAYPATIDTLKKIVKDKQNQTVMFKSGQAIVDIFTASAMVAVYDAMKPATKKKFEKMIMDKGGFMKTQAFAMKMTEDAKWIDQIKEDPSMLELHYSLVEITEAVHDKKSTFTMAPFEDLRSVADAALQVMTRNKQEVKEEEVTKEEPPQKLTEEIV